MALTLTTPVAIPNLARVRCRRPQFDDDANEIRVAVEAVTLSGILYSTYSCVLRNGTCQGVRATVAPVGFTDRLETFTTTVVAAYTDARVAFMGASGPGAQLRALETYMRDQGLLPAGTVA